MRAHQIKEKHGQKKFYQCEECGKQISSRESLRYAVCSKISKREKKLIKMHSYSLMIG